MSDKTENLQGTTANLPVKKQRTIMLVDDSEVDRKIYRRYLQSDPRQQYSFVEVELGAEAFEVYARSQPDIILLDYLLPDLDGLEWLTQWQQRYQSNLCPVIILTGQGDENIVVQFIKLGASDYLVKNQITAERLKFSVERAIALQQLQQEKEDLLAQYIQRNQELIQSNLQCQLESAKNEALQRIIDRVPVVVYAKAVDYKTKQSGKFWLVNAEFQRIFGLSESEIIGKSDRELFPASIVEVLEANDRLVIETKKPLTTEEQVYHADGKLHTYLSFKFPLFDDNQQLVSIAGIAKDITNEKRSQTELAKIETKFRKTFEQAAVGIAHVAPDGKWLRVNQKLCQILGYTKEELLQKTFQDITYAEDLETDVEYIRQVLAGEISTYTMEKRYICKNGSLVWIELTVSLVRCENGKPDYFIFVVEDISDRKQLELSEKKSLQRLSNLHQLDQAILEVHEIKAIATIAINNIQQLSICQLVSIVTFDSENNTATILVTQGRGEKILDEGFQVALDIWQDVIARLENSQQKYVITYLSQFPQLATAIPTLSNLELDCFVSFPLRSKQKFLGILKLWIENPGVITTEELTIVSEISSQVAIALEQARLYRQIQDYTSELEAKVARRTAQLEEINQELEAFTYSISHDLKAPLRAIQGFAIALEEDYAESLDDLGREYTSRLSSSAQQMTQLIQDLLTYSRLSRTEIQMGKVKLSVVVRQAIEQLRAEIEKTQAEIIIREPLLTMEGNKRILVQIVSNLLSNAIKFVSPRVQPQVQIWTEAREENSSNTQQSPVVRLWIEDNGIGIASQHQERIFGVFERLHGHEAYPGTGIGLAIAKKGMERLGGSLGVESERDRGSRFWIER
ncbi:MAG: PAS domain S-box protein [Pleurocapsa sp. MO_226.B13]|nr:PAS domain S-box protein [Pleurocapsa sp. MO_226.B13]